MPFAIEGRARGRIFPLDAQRLPDWCDRFLAPAESGDIFASRFWYDLILAHALPADAEPVLAVCGADDSLMVPLLRQAGGQLRAMVTPYSLIWRPLMAPGADAESLNGAGQAFARLLRGHAPTRLDALDPLSAGLDDIFGGMRKAGFAVGRFRHFANWTEAVPFGSGWNDYLAARPPALRNTIQRKHARALREGSFSLATSPGASLELAIMAYVMVREGSWKPDEPFPDFDTALLRGAAAIGALRIGVLWRSDGTPVAAQYWLVSQGRAALLKLAHDEAARADSPGTVLTSMMIRHLIDEDHVTELDFGRGDDAYKQLWATRRQQRIGVMLSDPWHPAGLLELARQAASRGRAMLQRSRGA